MRVASCRPVLQHDWAMMDLTGKILIAMPGIGDDRFAGAVILVCAHAEDFAMGLVLNKPMQQADVRGHSTGPTRSAGNSAQH